MTFGSFRKSTLKGLRLQETKTFKYVMAELTIIPKNESEKCGQQQQQHHRATELSVLRLVLLMGNDVKNHSTTLEAHIIRNKIFSVTL